MIGTSLGFSTSSSTVEVKENTSLSRGQGTEATQFSIAPKIGYFVLDNWALGIGLDYTLSRVREPVDVLDPETTYTKTYDSDLLFGPFTRFYLPVGLDKALFLEGTFGFGNSSNQINIGGEPQTTTNNVLALGVGPGFTIFSRDAVGIEALIKYNWAYSQSSIDFQETVTETTNITNALDFSVGVQVYFARLSPVSPTQPANGPGNVDRFYR